MASTSLSIAGCSAIKRTALRFPWFFRLILEVVREAVDFRCCVLWQPFHAIFFVKGGMLPGKAARVCGILAHGFKTQGLHCSV